MKVGLALVTGLLLMGIMVGGCAPPPRNFDAELRSIAGPYRFSIAGWEAGALLSEAGRA